MAKIRCGEREAMELIDKAGLELVSLQRGSHLKARVRAPGGCERLAVFCVTASDHRSHQNMLATLRRIGRESIQTTQRKTK